MSRKFWDSLQTADDVRDELDAMGSWDRPYLDSLTTPDALLGHLLPNVGCYDADDAKGRVECCARLIPQLATPEGVLIDADDSGGFNVICHDALTFAHVWTGAFAYSEEQAEINAAFKAAFPDMELDA